jgi:hypothetical protein
MDVMQVIWGFAIGVVAVACVIAATRRSWDKVELPYLAPPTRVLSQLPTARHPRVELEFHRHAHWGVHRERIACGAHRGWALHLGFGWGCLCIDFYRNGRRP